MLITLFKVLKFTVTTDM